jgi:DNA-binding CsgD family transcriptional regulator/tetratricopeptide (TPR) repeat protein
VAVRSSTSAFVGRSDELASLAAAFDTAAGGRAAIALVGGEAGVGKSRLVVELGGRARADGARVVVGHCLDLEEGGLPYAPFVDVLRTLERDLPPEDAGPLGPLRAALSRPARPGGGDGDGYGDGEADRLGAPPGQPDPLGRARTFELLLTLVERLTASGPLVLVVEDIHWADRSTLDLITLLTSGARHLPLLVVATYRSDEVPRRHAMVALLDELTRRGAVHLRLRRLPRGDVVALAAHLLGAAPSPDAAARIADRSDGNPLFVEELSAAIVDDPEAPIPPHLRDAVVARVARLPDGAAGVLEACAVGGRQVEHDLLAAVVGADDTSLAAALRACVDQQLLVTDPGLGGYRFRHALVHEAVLGHVLPGELARLHRAYAVALAASSADGEGGSGEQWARLAHHWAAAADYDAALHAAVKAGQLAERTFAVPEAHRYLEWSVRLWDRAADPDAAAGCDRAELLALAADAASRGGAPVRALTLVDEALATPQAADDPVRGGLLHERRGWYLFRCGRPRDALAAYDVAVAQLPADCPKEARARVLQAHGHALERAGNHVGARRRAEEAIDLALSTGDVVDEGQARHVLGLVLATEGRVDDAIVELNRAGQIAAARADLAEVAGAYVHLWRTLVEAGRGGDLVALILGFVAQPDGPDSSAGSGAVQPPSLMGSIAAAALHQLGRWDEAERLLGDPGLSPGVAEGGLTTITRTLVSGSLAVDRGDHDLARDQLETARAWCHQVGDGRLNGLLHRSLAELAIWQDRFDDAAHEVTTGLDLLAHTGDPELAARIAAVGVRTEADRVARIRRAASRNRIPPGPERVAAELVARLDDLVSTADRRSAPPTCESRAARLTGRAELTRLVDRPDPDAWQEAVTTWDGIGFGYVAAYCRYRLAEAALAEGDDRERATTELRAADATARTLVARPLRDAIAGLARRARIDLGTGAATSGPAAPADAPDLPALTAREREVLALLAEGRTNRQVGETLFISEKTASVHVSRLLAKLGAASRGEAVAIARRRGLLEG